MSVKTFKVDNLSVHIYNSEAELAQEAAEIGKQYLQTILAQKGKAAAVLATGNSQLQFLQKLIALGEVNWSEVTLFHLDEYLGIDGDSEASFRYYLQQKVERLVNPANFNYIKGDTLEPLAECQRYTQRLLAQPLELCCLGIGQNGHLAFNEPNVADFNDSHLVKLVRLDTQTRMTQVTQGHFSDLEKVPQYAFTVTIPLIMSAQQIICLAPGENKASIIKQMLTDVVTSSCPASILRQHPNAILLLDSHSAKELALHTGN